MAALVITLRRPRPAARPVRSSSSGTAVPVPVVEWDGVRGLHIAHCPRCTDTHTSSLFDQTEQWADTHHCDPELAALLAHVTARRTA
ncbi:hypothetical protein [Actinomadura sp. 6N118]|uniref:hypothetical protein n=1 Tax=Actinomadura sp. 6N118 TaxID=3375151 RepID=UPI00379E5316